MGKVSEQEIERIKAETDICNDYCRYANCYKCVENYLANKRRRRKMKLKIRTQSQCLVGVRYEVCAELNTDLTLYDGIIISILFVDISILWRRE